ncbi:hypothetical protein CcCBS67573_g04971 [Chytriomyces confervae]|uniref:F-box domain-containing protein n=1 Tax=Chytriomyces confervae TaxID=246404 RepID=A0A507FDF0_9FUNG|nr:hypothetical protein CcCBS67573_g04971 [Chytriomyces confervae]
MLRSTSNHHILPHHLQYTQHLLKLQPQVVDAAIRVPEILSTIFHFLSNNDMKSARLVNKSWNATATNARSNRAKNVLSLVFVMAGSLTGADAGRDHKLTPSVVEAALALAVSKSGLDAKNCSIQSEIWDVMESNHILLNQPKQPTTNKRSTFYLIPVTVHCTDHILSLDTTTLIRKFEPSATGPPLFISDSGYINDSSILAIVGSHFRRSQGLKLTIKCLTGSPNDSTSIFSRDTNNPMDPIMNGMMRKKTQLMLSKRDALLRDGYIGSVREGCFGSDFAAQIQCEYGRGTRTDELELGGRERYEVYAFDQREVLVPVTAVQPPSRNSKSLYLDSFHVTDAWLVPHSDPPTSMQQTNHANPLGPLYCTNAWSQLYTKCLAKGVNLERAGYTDKSLFYLRKHIFAGDENPSASLIQALRFIMYIWADKLSHYLDHDLKNKLKQADIVAKMRFDHETRFFHLQKLRQASVDKYLENPVGPKYLQLTGFKSTLADTNAIFAHLSLPEVHTTRSKTFHDKVMYCVNFDTLELFK